MGILKYFYGSILFAVAVLASLYVYTGDTTLLFLAITLAIIEISLSFDNAVVNASYLKTMSLFWKRMFLWVGIFIAVIGMRFLFPLVIVSVIGDVSLVESWQMAISDQQRFSDVLTSSHDVVAGFGGAFLMMVFITFFIDEEKEEHWLKSIESKLAKMGELKSIEVLIIGGIAYLISTQLDKGTEFFVAAISGIALFLAVDLLKHTLENMGHDETGGFISTMMKAGLGTFLFLEVLDASFSLDGVIAAFAISTNILVVAAGLGIGAIFVRSATIMLDETGALKTFKYLEHSAFWAIGWLGFSILLGVFYHLPEWLVAGGAILSIVVGVIHSIKEDRSVEVS